MLKCAVTDLELGWLAGLLEGEGSFLHPAPSSPKAPTVAIVSTDRDIVERVAALMGVKYICTTRRNTERWKVSYKTQLKGSRAIALMRQLRPLMGERRGARIDAILADLEGTPTPRRLSEQEARAVLARKGQARARDVAAEHDLSIKTVEMIWRGARWGQLQALG